MDLRQPAPSEVASDQDETQAGPAIASGSTGSRRPRRAAVLALLALAAVVVVGGGVFAATSLNQRSVRATPEEAARQYLDGVAANDVHKVLQACAIDEVAEHFEFASEADRLSAIVPTSFLLPTDYTFYVEMNRYEQASRMFNQVRGLSYSLLTSKPVDQAIVVTEGQAQQYVKDVDPARLAGLKVVSVKFPSPALAADSRTLSNFAAMAKVYGADELTERLALFEWNGKDYVVGFQLLRYGGDWKVLSQTSNLAGTSVSGAAEQTTQAQFDTETGS
jgi:hypothetical protein